MPFDHKRLDVYQLARASLTIANSIAEGAGKSAAMLDVGLRRKSIAEDVHRRGKLLLDRIVAMLVALSKYLQD